MGDQPGAGGSRSYKIRGHSRQRRSAKPYSRPSDGKKVSWRKTRVDLVLCLDYFHITSRSLHLWSYYYRFIIILEIKGVC